MELIRFQKNLGQLVKLVAAVIIDVRDFFLFICVWIFMFSLFYLVLGFVTDKDIDMMTLYDYFITSWKIATKGSSTIVDSIWQTDDGDYGFMDTFIMLLQILNEVYLKIIMLSFLIAIVKKSFDKQMRQELTNLYNLRCRLNKESSTVIRQFGFLEETDLLVLSAQFENFN